jgi:hypothetical protein
MAFPIQITVVTRKMKRLTIYSWRVSSLGTFGISYGDILGFRTSHPKRTVSISSYDGSNQMIE